MGLDEGGFQAPKIKSSQFKIWKLHVDHDIHLHPIMHLLPHFILMRWDCYVIFDCGKIMVLWDLKVIF